MTADLVMASGEDAGKEDAGRKQSVPGLDKGVSAGFLKSQTGQCVQDKVTERDANGWRESGLMEGVCRRTKGVWILPWSPREATRVFKAGQ